MYSVKGWCCINTEKNCHFSIKLTGIVCVTSPPMFTLHFKPSLGSLLLSLLKYLFIFNLLQNMALCPSGCIFYCSEKSHRHYLSSTHPSSLIYCIICPPSFSYCIICPPSSSLYWNNTQECSLWLWSIHYYSSVHSKH